MAHPLAARRQRRWEKRTDPCPLLSLDCFCAIPILRDANRQPGLGMYCWVFWADMGQWDFLVRDGRQRSKSIGTCRRVLEF